MGKKLWSRPEAMVEQFVADESVAACFGIECVTGKNGGETGAADEHNHQTGWGNGTWHTKKSDGSGCGWIDNQYIRTQEDGSYIMTEINSRFGDLECQLYTENWGSKVGKWTDLVDGQTVYWSTDIGLWNMYHYGKVSLTDKTRPLHS